MTEGRVSSKWEARKEAKEGNGFLFASYLLEIGWEWGQILTLKFAGGKEIREQVKESLRGPPPPRVSPKGTTCQHFPLYGF